MGYEDGDESWGPRSGVETLEASGNGFHFQNSVVEPGRLVIRTGR